MKVHLFIVRKDVIRGLRWGTIVLLAGLLALTGYRIFGNNPAEAAPAEAPSEAGAEPAAELVPPVRQIEIGAAEPETTAAPAQTLLPQSRPPLPRQPPRQPKAVRQPTRPQATTRPVPAFRATSPAEPVILKGLDSVPDPPPAHAGVSAQQPSQQLTPPPAQKSGTRAGRIARSVGRVFRLGRKREDTQDDGK
jgi:hypothetical protein